MLWLFVVLVLLSATGLLAASLGPLKGTPSAVPLRAVAVVQFLLAAVLAGFRLMGLA